MFLLNTFRIFTCWNIKKETMFKPGQVAIFTWLLQFFQLVFGWVCFFLWVQMAVNVLNRNSWRAFIEKIIYLWKKTNQRMMIPFISELSAYLMLDGYFKYVNSSVDVCGCLCGCIFVVIAVVIIKVVFCPRQKLCLFVGFDKILQNFHNCNSTMTTLNLLWFFFLPAASIGNLLI